MRQSTRVRTERPAPDQDAPVDAEVVAFRAQYDERSPLDQIILEGAQRMLQAMIEAEVEEFLLLHEQRRDARGKRWMVRNGRQPACEILTGAGRIEVRQPRGRDNSPEREERVVFSSNILPPYLRPSKTIDELIPWLYLKGVSISEFPEAL